MNSTVPNAGLHRNAETLVDVTIDSAKRLRDATSTEVGRLAADVEELVKTLANVTDSEVPRIRDKAGGRLRRLVARLGPEPAGFMRADAAWSPPPTRTCMSAGGPPSESPPQPPSRSALFRYAGVDVSRPGIARARFTRRRCV